MSNSQQVLELLADLNSAMTEGDEEGMRTLFTKNGTLIATDDTEVWSIDQACSKLGKGWRLHRRKINVHEINPHTFTFFEKIEHPQYGPFRATEVCVKCEDDVFRVAEYVLSCSVPNSALEGENLSRYLEIIDAT